jgi:hypothetical protein
MTTKNEKHLFEIFDRQIKNIDDAKQFIRNLKSYDLLFHFDDDIYDCLQKEASFELLKVIDNNVDKIYENKFDWKDCGCPIGYVLELLKEDDSKVSNEVMFSPKVI